MLLKPCFSMKISKNDNYFEVDNDEFNYEMIFREKSEAKYNYTSQPKNVKYLSTTYEITKKCSYFDVLNRWKFNSNKCNVFSHCTRCIGNANISNCP